MISGNSMCADSTVPCTCISRRAFLFGTVSSIFLSSCFAKPMRIFLNISLFNYLDRAIFDVRMNGTDFGAAMRHSFHGANAVMVEQPITLGPQVITWRLDGPAGTVGNGDTIAAKNIPVLENIPKDVKWLALHIYSDNTVEISLGKRSRSELATDRGRNIAEEWRIKNAD